MIKKSKLRLWQRSQLIQSSTTTDLGQHMGKWQNHKKHNTSFLLKGRASQFQKWIYQGIRGMSLMRYMYILDRVCHIFSQLICAKEIIAGYQMRWLINFIYLILFFMSQTTAMVMLRWVNSPNHTIFWALTSTSWTYFRCYLVLTALLGSAEGDDW